MNLTPGNRPSIEAVYIHIPFCIKKCHYCDFVSYPLAGLPVEEYCDAVIAEAALYAAHADSIQGGIKSIYIGGGTPTSIPAEYLMKMLDQVQDCFPLARNGEITVECNPKTVDGAYFSKLKRGGVNRLSIGAQAFQDQLLQRMGRIHLPQDIGNAVHEAQQCGIENINLDLIYGLPGQTLDQWKGSLNAAVQLHVPHIAAYGLKLGEDSFWGKQYQKGLLQVPDEDASADMFELAMDILAASGYRQYEISNFAWPGYFSVHNRVYWNNGTYLGLGVAASSHWQHLRQTNQAALKRYLQEVQEGKFPVGESEIVDFDTALGETIFLGLRLLEGLNIHEFEKRFGVKINKKYQKQLEKLIALDLIACSEDQIKLTRKGIFLANEVFMEFLP
ncbi:radical SAM family heme chaperone HemW [Candidatus Formimonas warabiya]|uniref:Heme chaperone HemW n=1 Tax=Formimonas warabiya TaxID=1761012 RepID=A0A3G1KSF1_FORW1|nr:radical SAM family heme chaperone HemW [Candidatus Formimonas warabiya]ATW25357.1 hypothetical protein DCMF_11780 [Candidatus Formimonas warabiya]